MQSTMIRKLTGALVFATLIASGSAVAGREPRLRLGHVRTAGDGVVVPVELVARRADQIAALSFDLRYDPTVLAAGGAAAGPMVARAGATLTTRTEEAEGLVRALLVPAFRPDMPALHGRRVLTLRLTVRSSHAQGFGRGVLRGLQLDHVVLGDTLGGEIHPTVARKGR